MRIIGDLFLDSWSNFLSRRVLETEAGCRHGGRLRLENLATNTGRYLRPTTPDGTRTTDDGFAASAS
eukprot:SAG11_NODE_3402_length_2468_cov_1.162516_3_plen_67_part_00